MEFTTKDFRTMCGIRLKLIRKNISFTYCVSIKESRAPSAQCTSKLKASCCIYTAIKPLDPNFSD